MKFLVILVITVVLALASVFLVTKFRERRTDTVSSQSGPDPMRTPEDELKGFHLADGFVIELIASEREGLIKPIDLTFDDEGRLWTQTASMYPLDPIADVQGTDLVRLLDNKEEQKNDPRFRHILDLYQGRVRGDDKIIILSDLYKGNGPAKATVWAEGLAIPMSIMPYKDGAYVAQGSELFFLNDSDKDGKSDDRLPLLTGFGFVDTHTLAHSLTRGPGGWIYFSHGAINKGEVTSLHSGVKVNINYSKIARFSYDAKKLELVSSGLNNIWGFQLRNNGQWYGTEANDLGLSVVPMEPGTGFIGIGNDRLRPYQPMMPELHKFRVGGTGISGLAFADDFSGSFPGEWKDVALLANPITSTINAVKIVRNPDGSVTAKHLSDLLSSEDKNFRPVNMEFGPDGCLYIADWYNRIISHNEISRADPDRDKTHGRIWRIRHKSQKPFDIPDFRKVNTADLPGYLKSPSLWMKRAAWHQISERQLSETQQLAADLSSLTIDKSQDVSTRIHALWCLEEIKYYDDKLMSKLLSDPEDNIRREAIRSLASFSLTPTQVSTSIGNLVEDPNPMVRSQVLRTLSDIGVADASTIHILVKACKPELPGNTLGGPYERKFERYLALKALEQYPRELELYLNNGGSLKVPVSNLLWAIQALPKDLKEEKFLSLWTSAKISAPDEPTFILISKMLDNKKIYAAVQPVIGNPSNAARNVELALKNQQQVQGSELSRILEAPVRALLKSNSETNRQLALDAIGRFKINAPQSEIVALIHDQSSSNTLRFAIKALENEPEANKQNFVNILKNKNFEFELRVAALNSLAKTDSVSALGNLQDWVGEYNDGQKKTLVNILSASPEGSSLLLKLYDKKLIDTSSFNQAAAERVYAAYSNDPLAKRIVAEIRKRTDLERRAINAKRNKYIAIMEKKEGDPQKGQVFFEKTCLMCHKVGQKGHDIAPALDGSSSRANEALVTAILNPDAAVEGGYVLYQVVKNDNSIVEGYLYNKDDKGVTIAFMGGSKMFIENSNIKKEGFQAGRSFMPGGLLEGLTDKEAGDLFAYIHSLK